MYLYLSNDLAELRSELDLIRSPATTSADLRDRLLSGTTDECLNRLRQLEAAGISEVFVWPFAGRGLPAGLQCVSSLVDVATQHGVPQIPVLEARRIGLLGELGIAADRAVARARHRAG